MGRDHRKLKVFQLADELVLEAYALTSRFPPEERYGLQTQIRRAAVSVAANLVEGSARRTTKDYTQFVATALGSASEVRYLVSVARRLVLLPEGEASALESRYDELVRGLQGLVSALERGS